MALVRASIQSIIDFALPPRCAGCGQIVGGDHQLCVNCWQSLTFLTEKGCLRCGIPLSDTDQICAVCFQSPPDHDGARAAVAYEDVSRRIILHLKHGGRTDLARLIAQFMFARIDSRATMIIPVPLHRWRIWSRGFNQSALIAQHLASYSKIPVQVDILKRTKRTPLLRGLGAKARLSAVRDAFMIEPNQHNMIKDQTILLIDDVYTSGATVNACAKTLKRAGAARVIILCWARVLRSEPIRD